MQENLKRIKLGYKKSAKKKCEYFSDSETRKRVYISTLGTAVLSEFLTREGVHVNEAEGHCDNYFIIENLEIADIKADNVRIDCRCIANNDYTQLWIPKEPYHFGYIFDFYVAIAINTETDRAEIVGFVSHEEIKRSLRTAAEQEKYYVLETSILNPPEKLAQAIKEYSEKKSEEPEVPETEHEMIEELFTDYLDDTLSLRQKSFFEKHIINCELCRENLFYLYLMDKKIKSVDNRRLFIEDIAEDLIPEHQEVAVIQDGDFPTTEQTFSFDDEESIFDEQEEVLEVDEFAPAEEESIFDEQEEVLEVDEFAPAEEESIFDEQEEVLEVDEFAPAEEEESIFDEQEEVLEVDEFAPAEEESIFDEQEEVLEVDEFTPAEDESVFDEQEEVLEVDEFAPAEEETIFDEQEEVLEVDEFAPAEEEESIFDEQEEVLEVDEFAPAEEEESIFDEQEEVLEVDEFTPAEDESVFDEQEEVLEVDEFAPAEEETIFDEQEEVLEVDEFAPAEEFSFFDKPAEASFFERPEKFETTEEDKDEIQEEFIRPQSFDNIDDVEDTEPMLIDNIESFETAEQEAQEEFIRPQSFDDIDDVEDTEPMLIDNIESFETVEKEEPEEFIRPQSFDDIDDVEDTEPMLIDNIESFETAEEEAQEEFIRPQSFDDIDEVEDTEPMLINNIESFETVEKEEPEEFIRPQSFDDIDDVEDTKPMLIDNIESFETAEEEAQEEFIRPQSFDDIDDVEDTEPMLIDNIESFETAEEEAQEEFIRPQSFDDIDDVEDTEPMLIDNIESFETVEEEEQEEFSFDEQAYEEPEEEKPFEFTGEYNEEDYEKIKEEVSETDSDITFNALEDPVLLDKFKRKLLEHQQQAFDKINLPEGYEESVETEDTYKTISDQDGNTLHFERAEQSFDIESNTIEHLESEIPSPESYHPEENIFNKDDTASSHPELTNLKEYVESKQQNTEKKKTKPLLPKAAVAIIFSALLVGTVAITANQILSNKADNSTLAQVPSENLTLNKLLDNQTNQNTQIEQPLVDQNNTKTEEGAESDITVIQEEGLDEETKQPAIDPDSMVTAPTSSNTLNKAVRSETLQKQIEKSNQVQQNEEATELNNILASAPEQKAVKVEKAAPEPAQPETQKDSKKETPSSSKSFLAEYKPHQIPPKSVNKSRIKVKEQPIIASAKLKEVTPAAKPKSATAPAAPVVKAKRSNKPAQPTFREKTVIQSVQKADKTIAMAKPSKVSIPAPAFEVADEDRSVGRSSSAGAAPQDLLAGLKLKDEAIKTDLNPKLASSEIKDSIKHAKISWHKETSDKIDANLSAYINYCVQNSQNAINKAFVSNNITAESRPVSIQIKFNNSTNSIKAYMVSSSGSSQIDNIILNSINNNFSASSMPKYKSDSSIVIIKLTVTI